MLTKSLEEEQAPMVDERLARVVQNIVEEYDGDVKAFLETIRDRIETNRKTEAAPSKGDEASLRKWPLTTTTIERISRAHYS